MPTVVALDVSLSMARPVQMADSTELYQRRHLAVHGINCLLDFISVNAKLEFTSLMSFSYLWERTVPFTRDYDVLKTALTKVELYNKTCIETALSGASTIMQEEWGYGVPCQVILVTDGSCGIGQGSLKQSLDTHSQREGAAEPKFPLPFPFPTRLFVLCVANPGDPDLRAMAPMYQRLIDINSQGGELLIPDGPLSFKSVQDMFMSCAEKIYTPFHASLQCGNFSCPVQLHPRPEPYEKEVDFQQTHREMWDTLNVVGFLDIADVASPPSFSRHLVLPTSSKERSNTKQDTSTTTAANGEESKENGKQGGVKKEEEEEDGMEDGKTPSFAVLLHGSLKVESLVALTKIGEDWFGMLYSWADSKKKSNLMLSVFEPGLDNVPWLGNLESLCPPSLAAQMSALAGQASQPPAPQFPVRPVEKRSYAQSCVVWIKDSGLQTDMQKVIRHARKLPDKQQQFYKEMNRIRRAALSFGFHELLEAMASLLERECTQLPGSSHPSASMQLSHAANGLRSPAALDIAHTIMPLQTNFAAGDR